MNPLARSTTHAWLNPESRPIIFVCSKTNPTVFEVIFIIRYFTSMFTMFFIMCQIRSVICHYHSVRQALSLLTDVYSTLTEGSTTTYNDFLSYVIKSTVLLHS
uniref:Uncharacterized protein n=1 Tax=Cacopsylla melanoneura TaxID=428564 RepID=A0A8D9BR32_9HEMI